MPVPCQVQKPAPKGAGFFYPFISSPSFWEEGLRWGRVLFLSSPSLWEGRTKEGEGNLLSPIPPLNLPPLRHKSERGREIRCIFFLSLWEGGEKKENSPSDTSWKGRNCHISSPSSGGGGNRWGG